jgi:beta-barrel assembly-enhancing protease
MSISRRHFVAGGLCSCLGFAPSGIWAKPLPTNLQPLMDADYRPVDEDERGMWQSLERLEERLASSDTLLKAPEFQTYTMGVVDRLIARPATDLRIYLVRDSAFNASMTPTGMMIVHTGLLVRLRNEAQYAAILGHEAGHYFRKHSLESYRSARTKSAVGAFVAAGANVVAGYSALQGVDGRSWIDLANSINQALVESLFRFKREQESEADAFGVSMLARAGYSPTAASDVWRQLIEERQQSASERDKRYKANALHVYSTHPPEATRMRDLADTAGVLERDSLPGGFSDGREQWQKLIGPHQGRLLDEQVKLNDPGASLYLIESLALDGWNGALRYYEGEVYRLRNAPGDSDLALAAYAAAATFPDAPADAWRAHGYALIKSGRGEEGRQALSRYLELAPDAKDAAMVRFAIQQ